MHFPVFDTGVPDGGYKWWYVDGTSADHRHHIVMIAFVGSVFSPHYFRALRRSAAPAERYCAFNLGVYSKGQRRWVLSEYNESQISRDTNTFALGTNRLHFDGTRLHIEICDRAVPIPRSVTGRITVTPTCVTNDPLTLDDEGQQKWWPYAPRTRLDVALTDPALRWQGQGYFDANSGTVPLPVSFRKWHWSRQHIGNATRITYHTTPKSHAGKSMSMVIHKDGRLEHAEPLEQYELPRGLWGMRRPIAAAEPPTLIQTLEDTPFYTRSIVAAPKSAKALTMHESLSLDRFVQPWVQRLLPFRTRR
ncbi:MAG: carotenoid 1,2-hydratase [Pseudomonadota bacterium]